MNSAYLKFFCGCDPAPSEGENSDDGAIVAAAAWPKQMPAGDRDFVLSNQWPDWHFAPVYARRLTSAERASAAQWSGLLHDLHRRFQFDRMVMDPNGGGTLVARAMVEPKQLINGLEVRCRPIGDQVRAPQQVSDGDFILHLWKRPDPKQPDPGILALYPEPMKGDDLFNQSLYGEWKTSLDQGGSTILLPPPIDTLLATQRERVLGWDEERIWCAKNLTALVAQAQGVFTKMRADGETFETTRNGAKQYESTGKKDLVSATLYCWMAFLIWLALGEFEREDGGGSDGAGFRGF